MLDGTAPKPHMWIPPSTGLCSVLGGVVDVDQMRQRSLNNEEVDGKTRYVAFVPTAGIKNGKHFDIRSPPYPDGFYLASQKGSTRSLFTC